MLDHLSCIIHIHWTYDLRKYIKIYQHAALKYLPVSFQEQSECFAIFQLQYIYI